MVVMNSSAKTSRDFIARLRHDFPDLNFKRGSQDNWSPRSKTITYKPGSSLRMMQFSVLHELAHAQLGHTNYHNDFELIRLEGAAWDLAAKIGKKYGVKIDDEHIQNCLDTYRDWLHARSTCPTCGVNSLQKDSRSYHCFNCGSDWSVTSGHFVRPYRLTAKK